LVAQGILDSRHDGSDVGRVADHEIHSVHSARRLGNHPSLERSDVICEILLNNKIPGFGRRYDVIGARSVTGARGEGGEGGAGGARVVIQW
jgi:hypothetical protein